MGATGCSKRVPEHQAGGFLGTDRPPHNPHRDAHRRALVGGGEVADHRRSKRCWWRRAGGAAGFAGGKSRAGAGTDVDGVRAVG